MLKRRLDDDDDSHKRRASSSPSRKRSCEASFVLAKRIRLDEWWPVVRAYARLLL